MAYEIDWRPGAIEDVRTLFDYLAESASVQVAVEVTDRILRSTDRLAEFPGFIKPIRATTTTCDASASLDSMCAL